MLFVLMLAFQLTGALILLLNNINGCKKKIIENCFTGSNIVKRDEDNNCIIEKNKLQNSAKVIYLNICAFFDLLIGYGISIFILSDSMTIIWRFVLAMVLTSILTGGEFLMSGVFAKMRFPNDILVPYERLENVGVDTIITQEEIDELFK